MQRTAKFTTHTGETVVVNVDRIDYLSTTTNKNVTRIGFGKEYRIMVRGTLDEVQKAIDGGMPV